jgi:hypothetical protein
MHSPVFNDSSALISVKLSQISYCGMESYMLYPFTGILTGFIITRIIYSGLWRDTQGFIGILPSDQSIYVVFRGTFTIQNWVSDFTII